MDTVYDDNRKYRIYIVAQSLLDGKLNTTNTQFIYTLLGNTQAAKRARLLTKAVDPKEHALWTLADLYTYLVAGCVGPFWTALHVAHRPRLAAWDVEQMSARGIRFGKALQMTNVLRDVPRDLRAGRCYLPARELEPLGVRPIDLLDPELALRARPLVRRLIALTLDHYDVAWRYTLAIPRAEWRMRLACAWPLLIGLGTLGRLARHPNPLAATAPIKVPRSAVRAMIARSLVTVWSNGALEQQSARLRAID